VDSQNVSKPIGCLIGAFKTVSTKRINESPRTPEVKLWHRNFYEQSILYESALNNSLKREADSLFMKSGKEPILNQYSGREPKPKQIQL